MIVYSGVWSQWPLLGWNYIGAKAKIPLIFVACLYKHTTQNTMYPFQAMSLSLQCNCTLKVKKLVNLSHVRYGI